MDFEVLGPVRNPQTFAAGRAIRDLARLRRVYGRGRWRKRKGRATVRLPDGFVCEAEVQGTKQVGLGDTR